MRPGKGPASPCLQASDRHTKHVSHTPMETARGCGPFRLRMCGIECSGWKARRSLSRRSTGSIRSTRTISCPPGQTQLPPRAACLHAHSSYLVRAWGQTNLAGLVPAGKKQGSVIALIGPNGTASRSSRHGTAEDRHCQPRAQEASACSRSVDTASASEQLIFAGQLGERIGMELRDGHLRESLQKTPSTALWAVFTSGAVRGEFGAQSTVREWNRAYGMPACVCVRVHTVSIQYVRDQ